MRYKKYILILLLVIFIGLNKVEATDCYYISDSENFKARMVSGNNSVTVNYVVDKIDADLESILNWGVDKTMNKFNSVVSDTTTIPAYKEKQCPNYLILVTNRVFWWTSYDVYAANNVDALNTIKNMFPQNRVVYGSYLHTDGTPITKEEYYGDDVTLPSVPGSSNCQTQYDICIKVFPTNTSNKCLEDYKKCIDEQCDDIFGDKNVPGDLAYYINKVMAYVRYIVPVLIILLGTLDIFKAVVASKEDEMKKAQKTLVKRVIIGIAIFLLPVLINAIMSLADMIWENYGSCGIDNIIN